MQLAFENKVVWIQTKAVPPPLPPLSLFALFLMIGLFGPFAPLFPPSPSPPPPLSFFFSPSFVPREELHTKIQNMHIALTAAQRTVTKYRARLDEVGALASRSSRPASPEKKRARGKFHKQPVPPRHCWLFPFSVALAPEQCLPLCRCTVALYCPNSDFCCPLLLDWRRVDGWVCCGVVLKTMLRLRLTNHKLA